ncbi:2-hydroxyacid dehydrogenase [Bordetella sp. H567]|uniref:NAD(P)-dependent oxidoreductase n=1 Tax=Bordetella sp. H567 TaxID=1697043 RepID=UPI00081C8C3F|nr:NAD(P)-dependent oxidoreductase [Bordetella sp. H567]AOB29435.1 2-hydroxyacid dehydrogenase [Bordetella sp. H567]
MSRLKVFLTYTDDEFAGYYSASGLAALQTHADVVRNTTGRVLAGRELAEASAGCQAIIAHRSVAGSRETFAHAPDLLAFLRAAVDISTVDVAAASELGILVTRASAGFATAVAELALAMILDLARGISRARHDYAHGRAPVVAKARQLAGTRVGIVGYGRIGRQLASHAAALGMRVRAYDPAIPADELGAIGAPFETVLGDSDYVVCLAASTPETENLMDAAAFARMPRDACFLNLARGELVDEDALLAALDAGRLRGAALDVGRAPDQKPSARFENRPDVVLMPHVGGMTAEAREHQTMDTVRQIAALAAGRMPDGAVNATQAFRVRPLLAREDTPGAAPQRP